MVWWPLHFKRHTKLLNQEHVICLQIHVPGARISDVNQQKHVIDMMKEEALLDLVTHMCLWSVEHIIAWMPFPHYWPFGWRFPWSRVYPSPVMRRFDMSLFSAWTSCWTQTLGLLGIFLSHWGSCVLYNNAYYLLNLITSVQDVYFNERLHLKFIPLKIHIITYQPRIERWCFIPSQISKTCQISEPVSHCDAHLGFHLYSCWNVMVNWSSLLITYTGTY